MAIQPVEITSKQYSQHSSLTPYHRATISSGARQLLSHNFKKGALFITELRLSRINSEKIWREEELSTHRTFVPTQLVLKSVSEQPLGGYTEATQ